MTRGGTWAGCRFEAFSGYLREEVEQAKAFRTRQLDLSAAEALEERRATVAREEALLAKLSASAEERRNITASLAHLAHNTRKWMH